jgi:hypothetical protein
MNALLCLLYTQHAFVAEEIRRIQTSGQGSQLIRDVVVNNWQVPRYLM